MYSADELNKLIELVESSKDNEFYYFCTKYEFENAPWEIIDVIEQDKTYIVNFDIFGTFKVKIIPEHIEV